MMPKLKKRVERQSGQALTELVVSMIAILSVFCGFLLVSALGIENVRGLLQARTEADQKSTSGVSYFAGQQIKEWSYGDDEIPFTLDDAPSTTLANGGDRFTSQLAISDEDRTLFFDMMDDSSFHGVSYVDLRNQLDLSAANMFLSAATLAEGKDTENNPLEKRNLEGIREAVRSLFGVRNITLKNSVFMPERAENDSNSY